jgi:hypothetical protein
MRLLSVCVAIFVLAGWIEPVRASAQKERRSLLLVVGAPGEKEFGVEFLKWAALWKSAAEQGHLEFISIGLDPAPKQTDYDLLKQKLADETKEGMDEFWVVFLGHGTFDGKQAKFNLRGPDVSSAELATWLEPFHRPLVVINAASCSGPFLTELSGKNRVIITATRSGAEQNFTHFGQYLSEAIGEKEADLDKDGQVSLLEAFLYGSRNLATFYQGAGRLATEHPLLDDNGDRAGTPPDWFRGTRPVKQPKEGVADGARARQINLIRSEQEEKLSPEQRQERDGLEQEIASLRETKSSLPEDEYYQRLEKLLVRLAKIYEQAGGL